MAELDYGPAPSRSLDLTTKAYVDGRGSSGAQVGTPTFVQQTQPSYSSGPYVWYQLDGLGNVVQVWVDSGLPAGTLASETFVGIDGSPWPSQWTGALFGDSASGATATQQGGQGVINPGGASAYSGIRERITNVKTGDVNVAGDLTLTINDNSYVAVAVSASADYSSQNSFFPQNGYVVQLENAATLSSINFGLYRYVNDSGGQVVGNTAFSMTKNVKYRWRLQRTGTTVRFRVWDASGTEPSTWLLTYTDAGAQPTSGNVYLAGGNGSGGPGTLGAITYWDNITIASS